IVRTFVDQDTGISYSTMNLADVQTFCPIAYENGSVMSGDEFNKTYIYLLDKHDNVSNYGWPFKSITPHNIPAWFTKLAVFTDEYADLASGLRIEPPVSTDGLVVCKNSI
ncbi:MAG: hypothetical protein K2P99_01490, partial [Burkholderiales bacterium]|nr:hypothetical protein [Burkholderiales bacterium]